MPCYFCTNQGAASTFRCGVCDASFDLCAACFAKNRSCPSEQCRENRREKPDWRQPGIDLPPVQVTPPNPIPKLDLGKVNSKTAIPKLDLGQVNSKPVIPKLNLKPSSSAESGQKSGSGDQTGSCSSSSLFISCEQNEDPCIEIKKVTWFHCSKSSALAMLHRTNWTLMSAGQLLMECGLAPLCGELGNSFNERGINKKGMSGVDGRNALLCIETYASSGSKSGLEPGNPPQTGLPAELKSASIEKRLTYLILYWAAGYDEGSENCNKLAAWIAQQYLHGNATLPSAVHALLDGIGDKDTPLLGWCTKDLVGAAREGNSEAAQKIQKIKELLNKIKDQAPLSEKELALATPNFPVVFGSTKNVYDRNRFTSCSATVTEFVFQKPKLGDDIGYVFVPAEKIPDALKVLQGIPDLKILSMEQLIKCLEQ